MASHHYLVCGWHVLSDFAVPALMRWEGEDGPPDVTIREGRAACDDQDATWVSSRAFVTPQGVYRLDVAGVAAFLLTGGREIVVAPAPGHDVADLHVYLLGTVLAVLCHQRGVFPLHASCVRFAGGAHAFAGVSGAGKSTLAAALERRGSPILSDDICAIDVSGPIPQVLPSIPRVKLWPDALPIAGFAFSPPDPSRQAKHQFSFAAHRSFDPAPVPLERIHLLETGAPRQAASISPVHDLHTVVSSLLAHVPRIRVAHALGLRRRLFEAALRIAAAVPVTRLVRCAEPGRIGETLRLLPSHSAASSGQASGSQHRDEHTV